MFYRRFRTAPIARWVRALSAAAFALAALFAAAQGTTGAYPNRPIRLIVPAPPGGPSDIIARSLAQALTESMAQPIVVENRAGGVGVIAYEATAKSPPDGYTLVLAATSAMAIQSSLMKNLPYETATDFAFIGNIGSAPSLLLVAPSVPAKSVAELIALAKERPGDLTFASSLMGSPNHMAGELLKVMAGIDVVHVPYKGAAPAEVDLLAGRVTFMFNTLPSSLPRMRSGQLRALGITSAHRAPTAPDVPTLAESGLPGFEVTTGFGLLGPAGMSDALVKRLNAETNRALQSPAFRERLASLGVEPTPGTPADYLAEYRREQARWEKVVKEARVRVE